MEIGRGDEAARAGGLSRNRFVAQTGTILLMAMSAAGPGFITQTGAFTRTYGASFGAVILASVVIDLAIQANVWRIVGLSGRPASKIADAVVPGAGAVLTALIVLGGLIFGIGNIAGAALGLRDLLGLDLRIGALVSGGLAMLVFALKALDGAVDRAVIVLGSIKIILIAVVAVAAAPPLGEALERSVLPHGLDLLPVLTLVGGTVGGFITYAGAHRLLDAGTVGLPHLPLIRRGATTAIIVTGVLRVLLFLGILGAVTHGAELTRDDPAGAAFAFVGGDLGRRLFGLALWTAGMTSTLGASYTSATFLRTLTPAVRRHFTLTVAILIAAATLLYLGLGRTPTALLIFAGAFNGLVLPFGFGLLLWAAWRRHDLLPDYRYPRGLLLLGAIAWAFTVYAGWQSLARLPELLR